MTTKKEHITVLLYFTRVFLWFLSTITPCITLATNGKESFESMLKDGRFWNCMEVYLGEEKTDTITREYRIEGTT